MNRDEIITGLGRFFKVKELVCPHIYQKYGEASWQFLDTDYLHALLVIRRDILQAGMMCNGGQYTQRGRRCNLCDLVKSKTLAGRLYQSAHMDGKAGDFTVSGMTAEEARRRIKEQARLLPCNIRLEAGVSWLHFDCLQMWGVSQKVYEFKA